MATNLVLVVLFSFVLSFWVQIFSKMYLPRKMTILNGPYGNYDHTQNFLQTILENDS